MATDLRVVQPVADTYVDSEFLHTITHRFAIAGVPKRQSRYADGDRGLRSRVTNRPNPITHKIAPRYGDVATNFHVLIVTYTSHIENKLCQL